MTQSSWERIEDGVFLFRDSCNVYAVQGPEATVLINAGTGRAADHLQGIAGNGKLTVLLTHHFRDHTDGARRLHAAGAEILGPYWEQEYLIDPEQHFRERQIWNSYDNRWDRFSPLQPLPVAGWMMDYEKKTIGGLTWEVIPTPGVTNGASIYLVTVNGRRLEFVGEVIYGSGRVARLAPLQYNYNDLSGAINIWHSSSRLLKANPDRLLPSLGQVIDDPVSAVAELKLNFKLLGDLVRGRDLLCDLDDDDLEEVFPNLYRSRYASAQTHFLISRSGKVLSLDYGYHARAYVPPDKHHLSNRRSLLHGIQGLKKHVGLDRVDTVLVTHFHDDHVNGIPLLQRLFDTKVWAAERFSDILERPARYDRPCLWHEPIPVSRHLPCGETIYWEEFPITLYPMSGHTRFATLVCMEINGIRVAHTGDQIFFFSTDEVLTPFAPGVRPFTNHVYKNGLDLGCYKETLAHLRRFRPQWVLTGHTIPYRTSEDWYKAIEREARIFDDVHTKLMPLGDQDVHFGAESQPAKLKPYRVHLPNGGNVEFDGWILNPFPTTQKAQAQLIGSDGWQSESIELQLQPRERQTMHISIAPPRDARCRRQPVGLDLTVGGRPFGQVTEALVTVGYPRF